MKICPRCEQEKSLDNFWKRKTRKGEQPASLCKACSTEKNRYKKTKVQRREKHLIRKYSIFLKDYSIMLIEQRGCCAICSKPEEEESYQVLHVDHCHKTGRVRGLLCRNCNHVLGLMKDNPELLRRAADF